MFKNELYVYGREDATVPVHVNYGKDILNKMWQNRDSIALIDASTGVRVSYARLAQQSVRVARWLADAGVARGSVVAVCSEKRLELVPAMLGVICAGATLTPIVATFKSVFVYSQLELKHRLATSNPEMIIFSPSTFEAHEATLNEIGSTARRVLLTDPMFANMFDEQFDEQLVQQFEPVSVRGWEDNALVIYSSGTTGLPKGIPVTHLSLILTLQVGQYTGCYTGKSTLSTREWCYSYGLLHVLSSLHTAATLVFSHGSSELDYLKAVEEYKIQIIQLSPSTAADLVKSSSLEDYDVSSVEHIVSSSSPFDADLVKAVKRRLPNIKHVVQMYGLSEAGIVCNELYGRLGPRSGSVGSPGPSFIVKVVDINTRQPLGPNQRGEICFKSPALMHGYLGQTTADYMDSEGFYMTGDVGYYDEDKYFYIVDRLKEIIRCNGYQVAPAALEAILLQHPSVRDVGVAGAKHPRCEEVPTALVVLQPGATAHSDEIVDFVDRQVPPFMRLLGGVRFVDEILRVAGKIDRKALKLQLSEYIDKSATRCRLLDWSRVYCLWTGLTLPVISVSVTINADYH